MEGRYKISIKRLKEAGFEVKQDNEITLEMKHKGGKRVNAKITNVGKEFIVATVKDDKKK